MHIEAQAIVCAVRSHGEHGAIVRALTPSDGLVAGYVRGGRSRRLRPLLVPGNLIRADYRARSEDQLAALTIELVESRDGVLAAVVAAPAARGWAAALVRYEYLLLSELGFGLDLSACVATGARDDLIFVSPKSGGAVSRAAGEGYRDRLLPLPGFLIEGGAADWPDLLDGLRLTGFFLERDLLHGRAADVLAARERLVDRLKRVVA